MAYDARGNKVDSINGYFLEPETDFDRAKMKNSDTSIMPWKLQCYFQGRFREKNKYRKKKTRRRGYTLNL